MCLEKRDGPTHRCGRSAGLAAGARKTAGVERGDEDFHGINSVHHLHLRVVEADAVCRRQGYSQTSMCFRCAESKQILSPARRSRSRTNRPELGSKGALGVPEIVVLLHAQPQRGTVSRKLADAQRHFRSECFALRQQVVQGLSRDMQTTSCFSDAELERRQNIFAQQRTRMRRRAVGIALGSMLGHIRSVVLLKVYTHCIAIEPFKCMHHGPLTCKLYRVGLKPLSG